MLRAPDFIDPATRAGFTFWSGVPCSLLTPFINAVIGNPDLQYIGASSEGEAIGIAAGASIAGRRAIVMCQNSGLGNMVNPLSSLNHIFRIPVLLIVTHRGAPGVQDEPQHELMGQITGDMLQLLRIPHAPFPVLAANVEDALATAMRSMAATNRPYAFIMEKGTVADYPLATPPTRASRTVGHASGSFTRAISDRMARSNAISIVREAVNGRAPLIATTGWIGRELYALGHNPNQLYVVGSMGVASAVAFGIHAGLGPQLDSTVVLLDGDGAALMKLGNWTTIGHHRPERFVHVLLDNEVHDSTGGQATVASTVDFASVAIACGYVNAHRVDTPDALRKALEAPLHGKPGPTLIHVKIAPGTSGTLPRPKETPQEVKSTFTTWLLGRATRTN